MLAITFIAVCWGDISTGTTHCSQDTGHETSLVSP